MIKLRGVAVAFAAAALMAGSALAAGFLTNGVPTAGTAPYQFTLPLTGNEQLPADTELPAGQSPQSEAITVNQLSSMLGAYPNMVIGGDASTNLFQRATTGSSVTTTVTYGGPDRWAYWSGTATAMTVSRDSTAADVPLSYQYAFKMARTSGQTGVIQVCMAQEIESSSAIELAGQTAELDFHAATGANFSAAGANMTAYIVYGTGTDEGMQKLAWGINAGGGGSSGWTGQTNATAAVISLGAVSTAGRYSAVANIPSTATEIGVALCFTPVGTAGTNDYVAFTGIELVKNNSNVGLASATVGYNTATAGVQPARNIRRPQGLETALQQRYYFKIAEGAAWTARGPCEVATTSIALCFLEFPTTMRTAPTMTYTNGFSALNVATAVACTVMRTDTSVASNASNAGGLLMDCTSSAGFSAASTAAMWGDNGGSGVIQASAEF